MHLLLVDNDHATTRVLEEHLKAKRHRVTVCSRGLRALEVAAREPLDLVIIEAMLPDLSGMEVTRRIRSAAKSSSVPVLFLSSRATIEDRIAGLESGGDDYVTKPFDLRELGLRIDVLLRWSREISRHNYLADLSVRGLNLNIKTFKAEAEGREVQLTPVEFELLKYLMVRAGQVVSAEQLLQDVWRYYPGTGDPAVVRVQVMNLRSKIECDRSRPKYIQTVYRHGYMVPA